MLPQRDNVFKHIMQGDKSSFEQFFNEMFPKLYRFANDFVRDKEIAREIAQESFVTLWESLNNLKPDSNLDAYIITICRNKCLNFLKHKNVILHYQDSKNSENAELEILSNLLIETEFEEIDFIVLKDKVQKAIFNLPEQCRKVFELSRFKKKKYSEIASFLNISQKTVEAHISSALKKLRIELKEFL